MRAAESWYVYLVHCRDDSLYCGIAKDVSARVDAHRSGRGAKYTRGRAPLTLAWTSSALASKSEASKLERRIKRLARHKKLALCAGIPMTTLLPTIP